MGEPGTTARVGPSDEEAERLLAAARDAIEAVVRHRPPHPHPAEAGEAFQRDGAAFVTLRTPDGELRGCIGELEARRPLIESVRGCAVSAALRDPRFAPVRPDELAGLRIGLSLLTPARPVRGPEDVEVGRHGVIVERGPHRGVLLPEVGREQGWDAPTFVAATCRKAGLPMDAWRDPQTRVSVFETVKIPR
ncbi:MAG TPA: AmmeMemoRadiSam system protein A [Sandaracinaceae bacterium LLY-WYZ-13_1]|nr:AmmeMemoRadiSam system protein A [Sandaracinaceae bacterium LLY-WYZ-13_1]